MATDNPRITVWNELVEELAGAVGSALVTSTAAGAIDPPATVTVYGKAKASAEGATGLEIGVPALTGRLWSEGTTLTLMVSRRSNAVAGVCRVIGRGSVPLSGGTTIRTLTVRGPSLVETVQRRASYRLKTTTIVREPVWLTPLTPPKNDAEFANEMLEGELMDASSGGVKLRLRTTAELRRRIERCGEYALRVVLPDGGPPVVVDAKVTHLGAPRDGWSDLGMQFIRDYEADSPAGQRVAEFVLWAERAKILDQREQEMLRAMRAKAG